MANTLALLILGFDENANPSSDEISKAFQKASLKFHPDAGGTDETFRAITLAKEDLLRNAPKPKPATKRSNKTESSKAQPSAN